VAATAKDDRASVQAGAVFQGSVAVDSGPTDRHGSAPEVSSPVHGPDGEIATGRRQHNST
jgi:hypothetical protein